MKNLLILVSVFAIAACSSKKVEEAPAEQSAMTDKAETPAPVKQDTMTMDKGENMDGGFPDVEGTERSGATCKNGGDERLVSVIDTREGPCGVVYTKHGSKKTVAYAKYDMAFCDKVYDNIVGNLGSGGFDCGGAGSTAKAEPAAETPATEEAPAAGGE